ncbi:MAG: hypothetical protein OQK94_07795 [Gammaproteobacteria bacterium]|nr:hypothetical protein [Gammaproteobacteria bacterium]MCW8840572.1 hypothetical protein [Gammaproteobacteria bacterium]MCW8958883.1 hypothetical protein [Gammaproteobacteria bacterium]MCW8973326.1 hypothetical protein [Gammaproteobacteria bacterium]MCW8992524.1 hypothetical protein [Gammaproteobacteria bacterium]
MPLPTKDAQSNLVQEHFAVIYTPRKSRERFPDNCVTLYESDIAAIEAADADKGLYAAKVIGPSRSSEGSMLYYLVHWL